MILNYGIPIGVSKLPYQPAIDEILYVEGNHTIKIERWKVEYYKELINNSLRSPEQYAEGYFSLIIDMLNNPSLWTGFTIEQQQAMRTEMIDSFDFASCSLSRKKILPSLFVYHSKVGDYKYRFQQFVIGNNGFLQTLDDVIAYMDFRDKSYGIDFESQSKFPSERDGIVEQMQNCARKLLEIGMDRNEIIENLFNSKPMQKMKVLKNGDILLQGTEYGEAKINLPPLDKAIYLLFLRHPEGINFSYLPDYREELMEIYRKLMKYRTTDSMLKSVEDVTDPTKNSINEKCARIRRAFVDALGRYLAFSYYITGNRGEAKKIVLDRRYVSWETEDE